MKTVGLFDAKNHLHLLLDEVEKGAQIAITRNGQRVARLEPVRPRVEPPSRRTAEEIKAILADARAFRHGHPLRGLSLRELIDDGRRP